MPVWRIYGDDREPAALVRVGADSLRRKRCQDATRRHVVGENDAPNAADNPGKEDDHGIHRPGTTPTQRAPESSFTGDVQIGHYYRRAAPSRLVGATAMFAAGSRTPWKINPLGQTLIVISGVGWAQCADEAIVEIRAGDSVWCPPGERHWEGATPDQAMTYVAIQEEGNAGGVRFVASVTDDEYGRGPPAGSLGR